MTTEEITERRDQIRAYLHAARRALEAAALNLEEGYCATAINRAYYAIFYAASGLLWTQGISRSKHAGVISAFREHFVKPGLIEDEYRLDDAHRFVERIASYLWEMEGIE